MKYLKYFKFQNPYWPQKEKREKQEHNGQVFFVQVFKTTDNPLTIIP